MEEIRIARINDNKDYYQLEKDIQNIFSKTSNKIIKIPYSKNIPKIKYLTLEPAYQSDKTDFMIKTETLKNNLDKMLENKIDLYFDLDIIFNVKGLIQLKDLLKDNYYLFGNIYYIDWSLAMPKKIVKYFPHYYDETVRKVFNRKERYSTMILPIKYLKKYFEWLDEINYKELAKIFYNKYFEEFLYTIYVTHYVLDNDDYNYYNIRLRQVNNIEHIKEYGFKEIMYYHLNTKNILRYYENSYIHYNFNSNTFILLQEKILKEKIEKLNATKKYLKKITKKFIDNSN